METLHSIFHASCYINHSRQSISSGDTHHFFAAFLMKHSNTTIILSSRWELSYLIWLKHCLKLFPVFHYQTKELVCTGIKISRYFSKENRLMNLYWSISAQRFDIGCFGIRSLKFYPFTLNLVTVNHLIRLDPPLASRTMPLKIPL